MKTKTNRYVVALRRRREGKTNYQKRLKLLSGRKPRLVIRRSLNDVIAQVIEYQPQGDVVKATASVADLRKLGWKAGANVPAAYLCGMLIAKRAAKVGIKEAVVDTGLVPTVKGSKTFAVVKGAKEAGLAISVSKEILPTDDRVKGKHIAGAKSTHQFAKYKKEGLAVEKFEEHVEQLRKKIME